MSQTVLPGLSGLMRARLEAAFSLAAAGGAADGPVAPDPVVVDGLHGADPSSLPDDVRDACASLVAGGSETCRVVALTVVAGTAADFQVKPDIIQESAGGNDFRSLYKTAVRPVLLTTAQRVSVPWQPSADPFVSNPFREERIDEQWVARRKNKLPGARSLLVIVRHVASDPTQAGAVLHELAVRELERLAGSQVSYRIPPRLTTAIVARLMEEWLRDGKGGRRLESLAVSLLRFAGNRISGGWDQVESHHVNDPIPYDALCRAHGKVRAVAEVKGQPVKLLHTQQLKDEMASHGAVRGYLFTQREWWPNHSETDAEKITEFIHDQNVLGMRIDVIDVMEAVRVWLSLADQDDATLPAFIGALTHELDEHGLLQDRRALADLLRRL